MFRSIEYPQATSNERVVVRVVRDQATCDSTCESASIGELTDNRGVVYPNTIRMEITTVLPSPAIRERKPRPVRNPEYAAPVHEISSPWQAKWRLRQQRPRDGLNS